MIYQVYNDELYHYGIMGMKWGRRKAKPSLNRTQSSRTSSKYKERIKQMAKNKSKKIAIIAGKAVVDGLTMYAVYKLNSKITNKLKSSGESYLLKKSFGNVANSTKNVSNNLSRMQDAINRVNSATDSAGSALDIINRRYGV